MLGYLSTGNVDDVRSFIAPTKRLLGEWLTRTPGSVKRANGYFFTLGRGYSAACTGLASEPNSLGARMTTAEITSPAKAMKAPTWNAVV
jgi:hypothetical protein